LHGSEGTFEVSVLAGLDVEGAHFDFGVVVVMAWGWVGVEVGVVFVCGGVVCDGVVVIGS